jgi:hypothetical protein
VDQCKAFVILFASQKQKLINKPYPACGAGGVIFSGNDYASLNYGSAATW